MARNNSLMKSILLTVMLAVSFVLVNQISAEEITVVGTGDGVKVLHAIGAAFTEQNPSVTVSVPKSIGSGGGVKAVGNDKFMVGRVARGIKDKEKHFGLTYKPYARIPIVFFVNKNVAIDNLTAQQVNDIYSGAITNWSEVGGPDMPVKAYIVKKGSATRKVFKKAILGEADYNGTTVMIPDAKIVTMVGKEKGSIGQISFAFIKGKDKIRPLNVDGQEASVNNSSYPITRPLHIATKGAPRGDVKAFLDWAVSPAGQKVVKERFVGVE